MHNLHKIGTAAALCAGVGLSLLPDVSNAGVMSVTGKSSVSLASPADQVHWRRYCHHHWRYGWRGGWHRRYVYAPRWRYVYVPRWRYSSYYPAYGSAYYGAGFNPLGTVFGTAAGLATSPFWAPGVAFGYGGGPWWW
jgi:hypothetical protein